MSKRRGDSRFRVGQVVCVRGMSFPLGCAIIERKLENDYWLCVVEMNGLHHKQSYSSGDLRIQTAKERGDSPDRLAKLGRLLCDKYGFNAHTRALHDNHYECRACAGIIAALRRVAKAEYRRGQRECPLEHKEKRVFHGNQGLG